MKATEFKLTTRRRALATRVLVVAQTRIGGMWKAYVDACPGRHHASEMGDVLRNGTDIGEPIARILFPEFDAIPYAD